jgi:pSer/pThr/pTyr-binding forkhead associated (FHA) protein
MSQFKKYLETIQEQKYNYDESFIGKIKGFFNNKKEDSNKNNTIPISNISNFTFLYGKNLYGKKKIEKNHGININASKIRIGRDDKDNDINIPEGKFISAKHLEIEYVGKDELRKSKELSDFLKEMKNNAVAHSNYGFKITDLGSTNGTTINGRDIGKGQSKIIFMTQFKKDFMIGSGDNNFMEINF